MPTSLPRGQRNNNPANIRRTSDVWQGASPTQKDKSFVQFTEMKYGIRALIKTLHTYIAKHNLSTIDAIIKRFAPYNENNTDIYIQRVKLLMKPKYIDPSFYESDVVVGSQRFYLLCFCICKIESNFTLTYTMFRTAHSLCNF